MAFSKLTLILASLFSLSVSGQTITTKFQLNPLHIQKMLPITLGASLEVTITPNSSLQISGLYRVDKTEYGITKGPKYYFDYRYYFRRPTSTTQGFYLSPFVGVGHLDLAVEEDILGVTQDQVLQERLGGLLLGYQPYKATRFIIDVYAGPEYQWRTETHRFTTQSPYQLTKNRLWFRAGLSLCFRLKR